MLLLSLRTLPTLLTLLALQILNPASKDEGNDNAWWGVVLREPVVRGWGAVSYLNWTSYHRG